MDEPELMKRVAMGLVTVLGQPGRGRVDFVEARPATIPQAGCSSLAPWRLVMVAVVCLALASKGNIHGAKKRKILINE